MFHRNHKNPLTSEAVPDRREKKKRGEEVKQERERKEMKKEDGREENKTRQRFPISKLTSTTTTKLSITSVHKSNIVFLTSVVAV